MDYQYQDIAKMIDHSLLIPTMDVETLEAGCQLALAFDVASVCIMPYYLKRCAEILADSTVMPSTTIGFPHGGHTTAIKAKEAEQAVADGVGIAVHCQAGLDTLADSLNNDERYRPF